MQFLVQWFAIINEDAIKLIADALFVRQRMQSFGGIF